MIPIYLSRYDTLLQPQKGLFFYEDIHRYRHENQWIRDSISSVISPKTKDEQEHMDRMYRAESERGTYIHNWIEDWLVHGREGDPGPYADWINQIKNHYIWADHDPVCCELRLVDTEHSIAGSLDCILRNSLDQFILCDWKTKSDTSGKRLSSVKAQLGGYYDLLKRVHPEFKISLCMAVFIRPSCVEIEAFQPVDAHHRYLEARKRHLENQPSFDF